MFLSSEELKALAQVRSLPFPFRHLLTDSTISSKVLPECRLICSCRKTLRSFRRRSIHRRTERIPRQIHVFRIHPCKTRQTSRKILPSRFIQYGRGRKVHRRSHARITETRRNRLFDSICWRSPDWTLEGTDT